MLTPRHTIAAIRIKPKDVEPEPYSHPVLKDVIVKSIFMANGLGRSGGLVGACSSKLSDDDVFNPIPRPTMALAATAVTPSVLVVIGV